MNSTVTSKGQVTLPKEVRDASGIKPGDQVVVRATASGGISIEKPRAIRPPETLSEFRKRLDEIAAKYPIQGTTDEIMLELRGDPAEDPKV
jgi:antitoxin PrlF